VVGVFIGVAWYANYSSKQRRKALLNDLNAVEPELGDENQFGDLFQQEMDQHTIDSERFDIDAEPTVTLSESVRTTAPSKAEENTPKKPISEAEIKPEQPVSHQSINIVEDSDDLDLDIVIEPETTVEQSESTSEPASTSAPEQQSVDEWEMVIAFTIMAREDMLFSGKSIKKVLESLDLHFGDMQIYHRQVPGLRTQSVFSVANIIDPGTLIPDSFATMNTPGLLIFSRLPGPVNGLTVFDDLLDTAEKMADKLDGVLSDESRQPVSQVSIEAMRSKILNLNIQLQAENNHYDNDY